VAGDSEREDDVSDFVRCEQAGGVTTITLNRPDCGNLVSNDMGAEIAGMIAAAAASRLIVLRGAGDDFCLGRDSAALRAAGPFKNSLDMRRHNTEPALAVYGAFRRTTIPVLGIVQGRAIGFGCALAGLCDVTIASDDARFQLPEMDHGIPPCLAMSALLGNVTPKAIMHLVYSTEMVDAQRALGMGLVSKIVARDGLRSEADTFIKKTLARVPAAVPAVKEYMRSAPRMEPQAAADFGSNLLAGVLSSQAH
jgi:enoyl-CoA hydratase/carnithine racemase